MQLSVRGSVRPPPCPKKPGSAQAPDVPGSALGLTTSDSVWYDLAEAPTERMLPVSGFSRSPSLQRNLAETPVLAPAAPPPVPEEFRLWREVVNVYPRLPQGLKNDLHFAVWHGMGRPDTSGEDTGRMCAERCLDPRGRSTAEEQTSLVKAFAFVVKTSSTHKILKNNTVVLRAPDDIGRMVGASKKFPKKSQKSFLELLMALHFEPRMKDPLLLYERNRLLNVLFHHCSEDFKKALLNEGFFKEGRIVDLPQKLTEEHLAKRIRLYDTFLFLKPHASATPSL